MVDMWRLLVVLCLLVWAWSLSLRYLGGAAWRWLKRRRTGIAAPPASRVHHLVGRISVLGAVVSLVVGAWSFYEPYTLRVTHHRIVTPKWHGIKPLRLVHLSDLHTSATLRLEPALPARVAAEHPDLIVFSGDAVNDASGLPGFRALMKALVAIAPVYAVQGNWEAWWQRGFAHYRGTGVVELTGEPQVLRTQGGDVWLVGAAVEQEHRIGKALRALPKGALTLAVFHFPMLIQDVSEANGTLLLSGDTHGGQINLPGLGALVRIARDDRIYYEPGLSKHKNSWLYVNRGIGMEGGHAPPVRFRCPPELAVIDLVAESPSGSNPVEPALAPP